MRWFSGVGLISVLVLASCDAVRLPGDGRTAPEPPVDIPDGAPGPPPPVTPVSDPYGDGETDPDTGTADLPTDADPTPEQPPIEADPSDGDEIDPEDPEDNDAGQNTDPELPETPVEPLPVVFQYFAPGVLAPGSGTGRQDDTVFVPDMVFPILDDPAFPGSQVWGFGGGMSTGGQCDARNYGDTPWRDNFCEHRSRQRDTPLCPSNNAHQGQDIRVGTRTGCLEMVADRPAKPTLYEVVAAEAGVIQYIGSYSINLKGTETGNLYKYLHLNMGALQVSEDDTVEAGDLIGYISDDFGGTPTTYHLHFEIKSPLEDIGFTHVPPYTSLVASYEKRESGRGERLTEETIGVASAFVPPEGVDITQGMINTEADLIDQDRKSVV